MEDGDGFTDGRARGALDRETYLAAVVRLAAADGSVDAEERVISEVARDLGLGPAAKVAARRRALDRAVGTEVLVGGVRDDDLRAGLLFDAYRVAAADGHVGPAELEELGRVALILGVHPVGAASVRPPASAQGPHAFLRHDGNGRSRLDSSEFAAEIAAAADVRALAARARDIGTLGRDLVDAGVSASQVTRTVSALADAVSERAICLVLEGEDLAGLDICWLAFGSEGRREQTLCTDQDNGLVFEPREGSAVEAVRTRLVAIARKVNDALAACGFSHCKGGVMAGNPSWCLTADEWRERFRSWIDDPTPEALLNASIFFDFRPLFGDESLVAPMREQLARSVPGNRRFLSQLAGNALARRPPLGFFHDFAVETGGAHAGTLDLKGGAAAIFVDAARIYALAAGEAAPGTEERMRSAAAAAGVDRREVEGWVEAFHFVQVLRLRHQLEQGRRGEEPHNHIDPYTLNPLERKFFHETLRLAASIQKRMERAFCREAAGI